MLGEDQYYIPKISDIQFGLEYETSMIEKDYAEGVFRKKVLESASEFELVKHYLFLKPDIIRVKYLDGDDIMSFGFDIANDEGNTYKSKKKLRGLGSGDDKTLFVYHEAYIAPNKQIRISTCIWWKENRGTEITVFEGSIRNKSEFRKILKQIHAGNITEEQ